MILRRFYSIPDRVDIEFKNGLNIICADISEKSTDKDSMNGAGKSTVLNLIDFCLLAGLDKKIKESEDFQRFTFILECQDKDDNYFKIKRSIKNPEKVYLAVNDSYLEEKDIEECKKLFKRIFFDLPVEENELTFRTLMNFVKRDGVIGFNRTFYHHPFWGEYLKNAVNLFLVGLNYKLPLEKRNLVKEKDVIEKIIFGLEKNLKNRNVPDEVTLRSQKTSLEKQIKEVNNLMKQINDIQNQIFVNNQTLEEYNEALSTSTSIDLSEIVQLYNDLKIHFSDSLKHELSNIQEFHYKLIKNRNKYLADEIKRIEKIQYGLMNYLELLNSKRHSIIRNLQMQEVLSEYDPTLQRLDERKTKLLEISHFIRVYDEISDYKKERAAIRNYIKINNSSSKNEINENLEIISQLITTFEVIYRNIANIQSTLIIGLKDTYKPQDQIFEFDIEGERKGSQGIERLGIFAYDLAIIFHNIWLNRCFPRFLMHDGIFHGVDKRQILHATKYVIDKAKEKSFQYITTMNTCDFLESIDYEPYIRLRLTDTLEGSLMGFKF